MKNKKDSKNKILTILLTSRKKLKDKLIKTQFEIEELDNLIKIILQNK